MKNTKFKYFMPLEEMFLTTPKTHRQSSDGCYVVNISSHTSIQEILILVKGLDPNIPIYYNVHDDTRQIPLVVCYNGEPIRRLNSQIKMEFERI